MLTATAIAAVVACASSYAPQPSAPAPAASQVEQERHAVEQRQSVQERHAVVHAAEAVVGKPYRRGASGPAAFDCSGLVAYSFARAGVRGLPRKAEDLERATKPVDLAALEPGDLLFFRIDGRKTSHVAIYVGDHRFVHAPSRGKRVERIGFDNVYWGPRLARAGRILD
jgi:cell wall-associated NlpC family hydrolase